MKSGRARFFAKRFRSLKDSDRNLTADQLGGRYQPDRASAGYENAILDAHSGFGHFVRDQTILLGCGDSRGFDRGGEYFAVPSKDGLTLFLGQSTRSNAELGQTLRNFG